MAKKKARKAKAKAGKRKIKDLTSKAKKVTGGVSHNLFPGESG
jgi:hypothetical protein